MFLTIPRPHYNIEYQSVNNVLATFFNDKYPG